MINSVHQTTGLQITYTNKLDTMFAAARQQRRTSHTLTHSWRWSSHVLTLWKTYLQSLQLRCREVQSLPALTDVAARSKLAWGHSAASQGRRSIRVDGSEMTHASALLTRGCRGQVVSWIISRRNSKCYRHKKKLNSASKPSPGIFLSVLKIFLISQKNSKTLCYLL